MATCRACGEEYDTFAVHISNNAECRQTAAEMVETLAKSMGV